MKTQTVFQNSSLVSVINGSIVIKDSNGEHTFTNASVVSVNNGTIIIESEWKPKKGELVKITGHYIDAYCIIDMIYNDWIFVFGWKKINYNTHYLKNDRWLKGPQTIISPVTPEEQKEFDDFCKSQGKIWNKETLQWEKYKWQPKDGEYYFTIITSLGHFEITHYMWTDDLFDTNLYKTNNCFKTEKEAKAKLEQIKKLLLEV